VASASTSEIGGFDARMLSKRLFACVLLE